MIYKDFDFFLDWFYLFVKHNDNIGILLLNLNFFYVSTQYTHKHKNDFGKEMA